MDHQNRVTTNTKLLLLPDTRMKTKILYEANGGGGKNGPEIRKKGYNVVHIWRELGLLFTHAQIII